MAKRSIGLGLNTAMTAQDLANWCKKGERYGFDSIWLSEDPYFRDCIPLMAIAAISTRHIRIATSIVNVYTKHPVYMAMAAATIDEISGGRLVLGLGRGVRSLIEGELKIEYGSPLTYVKEYLLCLRRLLAGEEVTFQGKMVKMTGARLHFAPLRKRIPTLLAAMGPKTLRLASRYADGAILNSCTSVRHAKDSSGVLRSHWRGSGEPEMGCALWTSISDDKDKALNRLRISVGFLLSIPTFGELLLKKSHLPTDFLGALRKEFHWEEKVGDPMWHLSKGDPTRVKELVDDRIVDALTVAGTVEECRNRIRDYHEAGVTTAIVVPMTPETFSKLPDLLS
jgi:5,10-methylenetetrahydromethanopterin reductase